MSQNLAYQLHKVAVEKYACSASALDSVQYQEAVRVAKRKIHIEQAVLRSIEAATVAVPATQVDKVLEDIYARYSDSECVSEDLQSLGIDDEYLYQAISREALVDTVMDLVGSSERPVSDTDVGLYYYMNIDKFKHPEIRTARHILITINEDSPENRRENALRRTEQIFRRLCKNPDRFEEQALKHSECPTSLQGGLLGKVKPGVLYPEIEKTLFAMKTGELSPVVESPLGFHLLRCDDVKEEGVVLLDDVLPKLREHLHTQNRKKAQRVWLDRLLNGTAAPGASGGIANA
ncbi:nitrogen fixation protein NifM [Teredinibacter haidensis]|uniref:nitrogen fixation protein NifM n=1 Tax=Teredinibacter haidensis TaxID=2731755 RepID=UPI001FE70650|nr:nitrogen fixation protein NifM [Teredinibacter haidensis]